MIAELRRIASRAKRRLIPPPPAPLHDWNVCPLLHPTEAASGAGGRLIDAQGREWIDLLSAWGANILGYGHPRVAEAIAGQARSFAGLGLPYPEFRALADLLAETIPCAESVRFGKNGSDATMGAARLARAATGRDAILHRGYHGFHDWWMASISCEGVPAALRPWIITLPDLAPERVDTAFRERPGQIACLMLDPMAPPLAQAAQIEEIRKIVHRHGALLIFDEIVSGFRVAPGGMQEVWNIQPDLACFGKAMANGMPMSAIAGPRRLMDRLGAVGYGMTFEGEAISIAAAKATLDEILEHDVCGDLAAKGRRLKAASARLAAEAGVACELAGPEARPHIQLQPQGHLAERELRWLFIQEMSRAGIFTLGTFNLCQAHGEAELEGIERGLERAIAAVAQARQRDSVEGLLEPQVLAGLTA